jgi:hypothetical protein
LHVFLVANGCRSPFAGAGCPAVLRTTKQAGTCRGFTPVAEAPLFDGVFIVFHNRGVGEFSTFSGVHADGSVRQEGAWNGAW